MMQAWWLKKPGGLSELYQGDAPIPLCGSDEVLIKVSAIGLNAVDHKLAEWGYATWDYPQIPGLDVAGEVVETGSHVSSFLPGDQVFLLSDPRTAGAFAEYSVAKAHAVCRIPDGLDPEKAAAIPLPGMTAWQAIHQKLHVKNGQIVAIHGANSPAGIYAIQLAKSVGAAVIAICTQEHHDRAAKLGADILINPSTDNIPFKIFEATEGKLLDAMIDAVSTPSVGHLLALLRFGGQFVSLASGLREIPLLAATKSLSIHEVATMSVFAHGQREQVQEIVDIGNALAVQMQAGLIDPDIGDIVPFSELREGLASIRDGKQSGRVIVTLAV
ncbi:zinc-binding dehydrogenase [Parasalinivibrio latis]|uniref:alcohol dehydrogenase catalytic domain-containing protein n=1 Tax=Parasalinivibrio latis TaxID=2952610 RepID=UPI0030DF04E9